MMPRLRFLLSVLILAGLAVIGYSRSQAAKADTPESHCAILAVPTGYNDDGVMGSKTVDRKCFESEAELMRHFTDGAVDLPDDASGDEVANAYQAYYESLSASENKSE